MDSPIVKLQNLDKEYPANMGKIWSIEEKNTLLQELEDNIDIDFLDDEWTSDHETSYELSCGCDLIEETKI